MKIGKRNSSGLDFIKSLDIFGFKFNILYKGQLTYTTKSGGCATIFSILVIIISLIYFSQNFLNRTNPRISSKEAPLGPDETFEVDNTKIALGFLIEDLDYQDILSNKWFETEVFIERSIEGKEPLRKNLSLMNCTSVRRSFENSKFSNSFDNNFIKKALCVNMSMSKEDSEVFGPIMADKNHMIHINLLCGALNDKGKNCLYDEDFKNKFRQKNFLLHYFDVTVDFDNLDDPFVRIIEKDFMFVNPYLGKFIEVIYSNVEIESDLGILMTSSDIEYSMQLERILHNYMINLQKETHNKNDVNIISVKLSFEDSKYLHKRVYYKLQHVFAEVGGIINGILLLGRLSVFVFSKFFFYESFINDYFNNYLENGDGEDAQANSGVSLTKNVVQGGQKNSYSLAEDVELHKKFNNNDQGISDDRIIIKNNIVRNLIQKDGSISEFRNYLKQGFKSKNHKVTGVTQEILEDPHIEAKYKTSDFKQDIKINKYSINNNLSNLDKQPNSTNRSSNVLKENSDLSNNNHEFICNPNPNQHHAYNIHSKDNLANSVINKVYKKIFTKEKIKVPFEKFKGRRISNNSKIPNPNYLPNNDSSKINLKLTKKADEFDDKLKIDFPKNKKSNFLNNAYSAIVEKKVNISCKSILFTLLCPQKFLSNEIKKNNQALFKFTNKVNNLLELDNILHSHKNIELIKTLFFNEKQRLALDYVKFEFAEAHKEKDYLKEIETIKEYFSSKQGCYDEQDLKILQVINKEIFQFEL